MQRTPKLSRQSSRKTLRSRQRKGVIALLSATLMVAMLAMLAFSIDLGYIATVRTEIQRAVDAGALAGASHIVDDPVVSDQTAREFVRHNIVGGSPIPVSSIDVEIGTWDRNVRQFEPGANPPTAIRVTAIQQNRPLFFARIFGEDSFATRAEAVATFVPRDIMVVLDYSASMNDDSELKHIPQLGRAAIEGNLRQIYNELGAPRFGNMQFDPVPLASSDVGVVMSQLGLTDVPYPFPSGSWADYIRYVQTSGAIRDAGYRNRYGYLTWMNYLLERKPKSSQTPVLWRTSEQPVTAVKNALGVFLAYLQGSGNEDRVGLAIYTSRNGTATLESPLTRDFAHVEQIARERQAGHYDYYTNIGAGMQVARGELDQNSRPSALKLIVLMTDGIANRPSNPDTARQFVRDEAQAAADAGYPVCTISLGANADQNLMQDAADVTQGIHLNVPGGQSVNAVEDDLKEAFRKIANFRPLRLVK
jgi:hypothetical protein